MRLQLGVLCAELALLLSLVSHAEAACPAAWRGEAQAPHGMCARREYAPRPGAQDAGGDRGAGAVPWALRGRAGHGPPKGERKSWLAFVEVAQVQAFVARGVQTIVSIVGQQQGVAGREDVIQPSTLASLGQAPLLAKVPERRCSMCGSLSSALTTDPVDVPQCCESCGCSGA